MISPPGGLPSSWAALIALHSLPSSKLNEKWMTIRGTLPDAGTVTPKSDARSGGSPTAESVVKPLISETRKF